MRLIRFYCTIEYSVVWSMIYTPIIIRKCISLTVNAHHLTCYIYLKFVVALKIFLFSYRFSLCFHLSQVYREFYSFLVHLFIVYFSIRQSIRDNHDNISIFTSPLLFIVKVERSSLNIFCIFLFGRLAILTRP